MEKYQRGQILLIIVLVMTIALTIGLSLATRSIMDIRMTTEEDNSQRAFSAAEAGIEKTINTGAESAGTFPNSTTYNVTVSDVIGDAILLNNGNQILKDEAVDIWLSEYPGYLNPWTGSAVTIYWGTAADTCNTNENLNTMAALDVVVLSGTKTAPTTAHYPLDPCSARATPPPPLGNQFEVISAGGGIVSNKTFQFKKTINITSGLLLRIIPLYAGADIAVRGCDGNNANCRNFPPQAKIITSVGTADNVQRKLVVYQENPKIPVQIFPFVIFSPK